MKVKNLLVFHARTGGDIEGDSFRNDGFDGVFFATSAIAASKYAEHSFMVNYEGEDDAYAEDLLKAGLTVFPVRISFENTAVLDRRLLKEIGFDLGLEVNDLSAFADRFEDSCHEERGQVFTWLHSREYDSAYLPRDAMPLHPGGDHCLRESYVAFDPQKQIRFALSASGEQGCVWSLEMDSEQDQRAIDLSEVVSDDDEFIPPVADHAISVQRLKP